MSGPVASFPATISFLKVEPWNLYSITVTPVSDFSRSRTRLKTCLGHRANTEPLAEGGAPLPFGNESRGWRHHWRHGDFGTLRSWASGSRHNV
eukprot:1412781-Prymnesium_polylepis.1